MPVLCPPTHNAFIVRPLVSATPDEREAVLRSVEYNMFAFPAALLTCDYLSDSGTSAMTDVQWAAMMRGDESYGRNSGYYCLLDAFRDVFQRGDTERQCLFRDVLAGTMDANFIREKFLCESDGGFVNGGMQQIMRPNFFIVPQGRCAESLLFSTMGEMLREQYAIDKPIIISNGFFDTTAANAQLAGFGLFPCPQPGLTDPFPVESLENHNPFKGNLDISTASAILSDPSNEGRAAMVLLTITNNWAAGQPVSLANIRATADLAKKHGIPLFFDACRFAENAKFIQDFEEGYSGKTISEIVRETFSYADGFTISLKKDGLANMGGALCFRDRGLFASKFDGAGVRLKEKQIVCYGNDSYGGMSGRDLMAAAVGLYEVTKETFLAGRIGQVRKLALKLVEGGIPVLLPPGGHAVFLDMDQFFQGCGRSYGEFAALGFTLELLREYGIRAMEAGPFGWGWDTKEPGSRERNSIPNLVRLAVPRNVIMDSHIEYTVQAISNLYQRRHTIPGARISRGGDLRLRHFQCGLEPVPVQASTLHVNGSPPGATFLNRAIQDFRNLSSVVAMDDRSRTILADGLEFALQPWGQRSIPGKPSGWLSQVALDHSPVEYSMAVEPTTGHAQLRFMVEAQAEESDIKSYQESALLLTRRIHEKYPDHLSLERLDKVRDLFFPTEPKGSMVAWHSLLINHGGKPEWKIYLNPRIQGASAASGIIQEALKRLGMDEGYSVLERLRGADANVSFVYFSLDLCPGPRARVKVYLQHHAADVSTLAKQLSAIDPEVISAEELHHFCAVLSGQDIAESALTGKPLISCIAFTRGEDMDRLETETTLHFPVSHYAPHDAEIRRRVEELLQSQKYLRGENGPSGLEIYQKCIDTVAHRALDAGRGIHSWIGLKNSRRRGTVITFYLEPEMYGVLPGLEE